MNNLTEKELTLFKLMLKDLETKFESAGCNDLDPVYRAMFTKEEWIEISKQYFALNGTPEDHNDNYADCMMDFMVWHYLKKKAGL